MQKITTFLTFNDRAEEAVRFYVSVFKDSKIINIARMGEGGPGVPGTLMHATFELHGQIFMAINGGPHFTFAQGISLLVTCETQHEIDDLWAKLTQEGEPSRCGWLKDKFGVSWQVVPAGLGALIGGPDARGSKRAMEALLVMEKIDIALLREAYKNG